MKNKITLSIAFLIAAISFNSCTLDNNRVVGSGDLQKRTYNATNFHSIQLGSVINLEIEQSEETSIVLESQENLMDYIEIYIYNNTLYIDAKDAVNLAPSKKITVYVTTPEIRSIESNGTGDTYCASVFDDLSDINFEIDGTGSIDFAWSDANSINVELDGTGDIFLVGNGNSFDANIDGTGNLDFDGEYTTSFITIDGTGSCFAKGATNNNTVKLNGTGSFYGKGYQTEYSNISINGTGDAEVFSTHSLIINLDGSGDVYYYGNPSQLQVSNDGTGDVYESN